MRYSILVDFGSTFTKMAIADHSEKSIVHTARFPSTVRTDAETGLNQCLESALKFLGPEAFGKAIRLASSSAAGGLRMAVVGISPTLSVAAGRNAALGAGAKILKTMVGELTAKDIESLEGLAAEIILMCGGYENGCTDPLEHNARMLARGAITAPVIFAGNSRMAQTVRGILIQGNKECFIADNIIPEVGKLNIGPTQDIIRNVFMNRIINMKGLSKICGRMDGPIIPTPAAILEAGLLLSTGYGTGEGLGSLMLVDVGGATTDVHTYVEERAHEGARLIGAKEPFARRTVEGDMGVRESAGVLLDEFGWAVISQSAKVSLKQLKASIQKRTLDTEYVPDSPKEKLIDQALASAAVYVSARRHAGRIEYTHSSNCQALQKGKNIRPIKTVIGTGGPLVNSENPREILENVRPASVADSEILLPEPSRYYLDAHYVFYAAGLLKAVDENLALAAMKNSLRLL